MSPLNHPFDIARRFFLTMEDRGIGGDTEYALVFTTNGQMVVRVSKEYEQPNKTPDIRDIEPSGFAAATVNGVPLHDLVVKKLREILPDSN